MLAREPGLPLLALDPGRLSAVLAQPEPGRSILDLDADLAPVLVLDAGLDTGLSFWPPGLLVDCGVSGFLATLSDLPFPLLLYP